MKGILFWIKYKVSSIMCQNTDRADEGQYQTLGLG